jgi:hypothetical protein
MAKRVLFSGSIAGHALGYGGNSWAFLQWLLGFRRLGFDVYYVEERRDGTCLDEHLKPVPLMDRADRRYFRQVMERRVSMPIEVCLAIADSDPDLSLLRANAWNLAKPGERVRDPDSYRSYIQQSRGEFSPVRPMCSLGKSGWFSDRSGCYLAAGRPVVMEDTGLGRHVPVGLGLLTYVDVETAVQCLETIQRDYARHAAAAREFAREHLDSDRVLARIVELARL